MKPRTKARSIALQVLYEIDLVGHAPAEALLQRLADDPLEERLQDFARLLVFGIWPRSAELDRFIAEHAPEWPMDQVAVVDRNILRMALWEFAVDSTTPTKVAINEAVELAKLFGSDSAPRFVNGVLGSLAERRNEIRQALESASQSDVPDEPNPSPA